MSKIIDATNVIGGHIRNEGGKGFSYRGFVDFATHLCDRGADKALVKFGKLPGDNSHPEERTVLRIASIAKDNIFRCDMLNPLFRTSATKAVNNDVRKTFINALKKQVGDLDVKQLVNRGLLELKDFVNEKTAKEIKESEEPVRLSQLFEKIETNGSGKPLSAREILNIDAAIGAANKYPGVTGAQLKIAKKLETGLRTVFNDNTLNEEQKIEGIKNVFTALYINEQQEHDDNFNLLVGMSTALNPWNSFNSRDLPSFIETNLSPNKDNSFVRLLVDTYKKVKEDSEKKPAVENNNNMNAPGNIVNENNNVNVPGKQNVNWKEQLPKEMQKSFEDFEKCLHDFFGEKNLLSRHVKFSNICVAVLKCSKFYAFPIPGDIKEIMAKISQKVTLGSKPENMTQLIKDEITKVGNEEERKVLEANPLLNAIMQVFDNVKAQYQQEEGVMS